MTLVRCPACLTTTADPAPIFCCAGCGQQLRWSQAPSEPASAPPAVPQPRRRSAAPAPDVGMAERAIHRAHQEALAAITELFHHDEGQGTESTAESIERAREVLTTDSVTELRETAVGAAWFAAVALRTIDAIKPGAGLEMLQQFGLILAQERQP